MAHFVQDIFKDKHAALAVTSLAAIGVVSLLNSKVLPWFSYFNRVYLRKRLNLSERYG